MPRVFTKPEQIKLIEKPYITYVGNRVLKFDKQVLEHISTTCNTMSDVRQALISFDIPMFAITSVRVHALYTRYVSKGFSVREKMPRKYFSEQEMNELIQLDVVSKITSSTITYAADFKIQISNCNNLTEARDLIIANHVPLDIIGERQFENSYYDFEIKRRKKVMQAFQMSNVEESHPHLLLHIRI